jgi:hypothetical protein
MIGASMAHHIQLENWAKYTNKVLLAIRQCTELGYGRRKERKKMSFTASPG